MYQRYIKPFIKITDMETAKELLKELNIKDTVFIKDEWLKGGLSEMMESYAKQKSIEFLESIKEYEREAGKQICFDERESEELYQIYIEK